MIAAPPRRHGGCRGSKSGEDGTAGHSSAGRRNDGAFRENGLFMQVDDVEMSGRKAGLHDAIAIAASP